MNESIKPTIYWRQDNSGRVVCTLCPHECALKENQRGLCFIRQNINNQVVLTSFDRSSGFAVDPIEKKPLNHFLPGSAILSFGTAGCNMLCKFCQNWDMSKAREMEILSRFAAPQDIVRSAKQHDCSSIAYTYNDPVIFLEYAVDTAYAAREEGIKSVAVTAGYIQGKAREDFFNAMDAVNIDLKSFNSDFYQKLCGAKLQPVLDTILYVKNETGVWLELTNLLIPGQNDSRDETGKLCRWVVNNLGADVPLHFSAFHPDFKMKDTPPTPSATLLAAREIAIEAGLKYVYTGNILDSASQSTYCHACKTVLIGRSGYEINEWRLDEHGKCRQCAAKCTGVFEQYPGNMA